MRLSKDVVKTVSSSILLHLVQTDHTANIEKSFKMIYRVNSSVTKSVSLRILQMAEAVAIRIKKPEFHVQENFVQLFPLPWPISGLIS